MSAPDESLVMTSGHRLGGFHRHPIGRDASPEFSPSIKKFGLYLPTDLVLATGPRIAEKGGPKAAHMFMLIRRALEPIL